MGLACSQAQLLTLTRRKADCQTNMSIASMEKMALTRKGSELSKEYYKKLQNKQVSYYYNNQYNLMNYKYLMGYGADYTAITEDEKALKTNNNMILTDYKGQVILSDEYANALENTLGIKTDTDGRGSTFSLTDENLAKLISNLCSYSETKLLDVIKNGSTTTTTSGTTKDASTLDTTGTYSDKENTTSATSETQQIIDFYRPIFQAAAANGWTTEYNKDYNSNNSYISDALNEGLFQLELVEDGGEYTEGTSLTYFTTAGLVDTNSDSDTREEITAWYNAEQDELTEQENVLDMDINDWSTELEAINTEIQSIQSFIDDAISSVFDWGNG